MTATQPLTETTVLANDVKMPTIGFGTWQIPINENFDSTIQTAIQLGYRQFDTAQIYNNAQRMGEAIRASDVPRSEFFLTSKIWASHRSYESAREAYEMILFYGARDEAHLAYKAELDALAAEAAQAQGYVRLWLGPSPDEACGFLFACSLLAHAVCRVGVVVLGGLHPGPQGTLVQLAAGGELAPEALGAFLPQEKPLGAPQLGALSGMWAALKAEDAPLRALVNGRLVGVPEHFYDPWLLRAIPRTGSFQAAVAIGRALAAVPGVGDAVFVQRLQALLAAGALRMVQPGADGHFYGAVLAVQDEAKLRAGA